MLLLCKKLTTILFSKELNYRRAQHTHTHTHCRKAVRKDRDKQPRENRESVLSKGIGLERRGEPGGGGARSLTANLE